MILALLACARAVPVPDLSVDAVAVYIREDVKDDRAWAIDVRAALIAAHQPVDEDHVCQVLAVVEQESGYEPDPAVAGLGRIVEEELDAELERLGRLAPFGKDALLDHAAEGSEYTFRDRMHDLETERDLDLWFRDVIAYHEGKAPIIGKAARLFFPRLEERLNPIRTSGSMQVSVSWAQDVGKEDGFDARAVRDALYTRAGGLRYGTARLFAHEASYDRPIYRFADYNAGLYASRNAQFQAMLADLTETPIATDGDLLRYDRRGRPTSDDGETTKLLLSWAASRDTGLTASGIRRDLTREKQASFEKTATWDALREAWTAKREREPSYAKIPDVKLDSPKLNKDLTTRWFAEKVEQRYTKCRRRG